MPRGQKFKPEEIIAKLREAEVELARGKRIPEACKQIGVTESSYDRWRNQYGGMKAEEAVRLKKLEDENRRLRELVAEKELDIKALKLIAEGNW